MSSSLIKNLYEYYDKPKIDLLVNDDTFPVAKLLPHIDIIHTFSYNQKKKNRWSQEKKIFKSIFRKYDVSINLTASDRSVIYALLASKKSISAVETKKSKSWWKIYLLSFYYYFDNKRHILLNNLSSLDFLGIDYKLNHSELSVPKEALFRVQQKLSNSGIKDFFIFHPSAQYTYKIYPKHLRNDLLNFLKNLGVPIIITGSKNTIDSEIKKNIESNPNIFNWIGETSIEEYLALSFLSKAYIGMDTLNMHIAASQNKRIFAIFGPTNLSMWSPWSNKLETCAHENLPIQSYGKNTIFQADMLCVACGKAGCDDNHGVSECLYAINPKIIFEKIEDWYTGLEVDLSP